ncbi:MAG TPA: hypothetical protein VHG52_04010, partial [Thermomicrobiales bacterium]|nr:hypothetical protein [Thermomicrobiales bacterium]
MVRVEDGLDPEIRTQNLPQTIRFQQIELMILPATPFELADDESGFVLQNTDYMAPPGADPRAGQPTNRRIYMRGAAAYNIDKVGESVVVPIWGAGAGSLQFDLNELVDTDIEPGVMDTAMFYAFPEPSLGRDQTLRYPMLNLTDPSGSVGPTTMMSFRARLFPADHGASIFEFAGGPVLQSYFQTYHGYPVHLVPQAGAGLTFTHVPNPGVYPSRAAEVATHYGLTPVGGFEMVLDNPPPGDEYARLIGGQSGTEYVSFNPRRGGAPGDVLTFFRNKPGYAPGFTGDPNATSSNGTNGSLLSTKFLTSWASVRASNGTTPQYYAQPDDAVLHGERVVNNPFLEYVEVPTTDLLQPPTDADCFPLVPLSGVIAPDDRISPPVGPEIYLLFEQKVMNPARKDTISSVNPNSHASANGRSLLTSHGRNTTTPQGMLVHVHNTDWQQLTLAKDDADPVNYFRFDDISAKFQDALSANRLFLVASRQSDLVQDGTGLEDLLTVSGWPFKFEIGQPPNGLEPPEGDLHRYNNVLVFKFANKPFQELLDDTLMWSRPEEFNDTPSDVQEWLQALIQDVRDTVADGGDDSAIDGYVRLLENLDNPNWHGILGFNVSVPPSGLPCEVQPLLGG